MDAAKFAASTWVRPGNSNWENNMRLYHGTNGAWLDNILRVGLEPRGNRSARNNWKHVAHQSNPHCIYLTDSYAPYFAFNAARGKNPRCAVIEIETDLLDNTKLIPDEDAWEQLGRKRDDVPGTMSQRTLYYRSEIDRAWRVPRYHTDREVLWRFTARDDPTLPPWQVSLRALGTCAYRGAIPTEAITRAVKWPHVGGNVGLMFVWDPTITLINQRLCGPRYKALTAKLFGDELPGQLSDFDEMAVARFSPDAIEGLQRRENLNGCYVEKDYAVTD
jgi:hypothetical protein